MGDVFFWTQALGLYVSSQDAIAAPLVVLSASLGLSPFSGCRQWGSVLGDTACAVHDSSDRPQELVSARWPCSKPVLREGRSTCSFRVVRRAPCLRPLPTGGLTCKRVFFSVASEKDTLFLGVFTGLEYAGGHLPFAFGASCSVSWALWAEPWLGTWVEGSWTSGLSDPFFALSSRLRPSW